MTVQIIKNQWSIPVVSKFWEFSERKSRSRKTVLWVRVLAAQA